MSPELWVRPRGSWYVVVESEVDKLERTQALSDRTVEALDASFVGKHAIADDCSTTPVMSDTHP